MEKRPRLKIVFGKFTSASASYNTFCLFMNNFIAASLCEAMKKQRETPIVQDIGDVMLARVGKIIVVNNFVSIFIRANVM